MKKLLLFILLLLYSCSLAQYNYLPPVEKWSPPVRIDPFANKDTWESEAFLKRNMDTIYYFSTNAIFTSIRNGENWQSPSILNSHIDIDMPLRSPTLSKDGKRLYFSGWGGYGNWDIWYSDLDSASNWGQAVNMGPKINTGAGEYYLYELSKDTIYVVTDKVALQAVCLFKWESAINDWQMIDSFYYHPLGGGPILGLSITEDRKKLYFSKFFGENSLQSELAVCYWDTTMNNWGMPHLLNINSKGYKVVTIDSTGYGYWAGGWDEYPWISPDGKTLYFDSNRDAAKNDTITFPDIYVSRLIIDENGDSIAIQEKNNNALFEGASLYPKDPNLFLPQTGNYELAKAKLNYASMGAGYFKAAALLAANKETYAISRNGFAYKNTRPQSYLDIFDHRSSINKFPL